MEKLRIIILGFLGAALFQLSLNIIPLAFSKKSLTIVNANEINLLDAAGKVRIKMAVLDDTAPNVWFFDNQGKARLIQGLYHDQTSYYGLQDAQGQMIQLARSFGNQESPLLIFKNKGKDSMITGLNPSDQTPFTMYYDRNNKRQLNFGKYDGP